MDGWTLTWDTYAPAEERRREALCTLGNGYFATRGAAEECAAGPLHYPGTYLAGGYDRLVTTLHGQVLVNEDLVNWPNWLTLTFRPDGGEWLDLDVFEVLAFHQALDLRRGLLERRVRFRDRDGRTSRLRTQRIVSMHDPHVAAVDWTLIPEDWSGTLRIRSALDGTVRNAGVDRYAALRGDHLVPEQVGSNGLEVGWLLVRSRQSRIRVAQVLRTRLREGAALAREVLEHEDRLAHELVVEARTGHPIRVEKTLVMTTSRDHAASEPLRDARIAMSRAPDFEALRRDHDLVWSALWSRCDIQIGARDEQRILRLHVFHLLQVASPHVIDRDVGVPARGLHGEAYRGHVFWDELFIFPYLTYSLPDLTRELLLYRYRRLPAARCLAREQGRVGACFPWQSGSNGREESQVLHLNPKSGRWVRDDTHLQRHINAAVAYNVWQYFEATEDAAFLESWGAEVLVEIARYWASSAQFDPSLGRCRIRGVVGPDEFHTAYPDADTPGLDDNAYTNVMAAWCLRSARLALDQLGTFRNRELVTHLGLTEAECAGWERVGRALYVPFLSDGRIISQFHGYEALRELDWEACRRRHGDIQRLDRLLEADGDSVHRYKASKQADVLMLFYLFSSEELVELLASMGYPFDPAWIPENIDYYTQRTSHGSTLSRVIHSWVLARSDRERSWRLFQEALRSDVRDIQDGTTSEGIHLGALAGTVDLVQRGYTGAVIRDGVLWLGPRLPEEMKELSLRYRVRSAWLEVRVTPTELEVRYETGRLPSARVGFEGTVYTLPLGTTLRLALARQP